MKKLLVIVLAVIMGMSLAACQKDQGDVTSTPELKEENGIKTCLDTEKSPFNDCGIRTVVDAANGTVTFTKTDMDGKDTVEYFKFIPDENMVEQYYYVSMMGTGFYYYYDLIQDEMVRVENTEHVDVTDSAKENGRFDGSAKKMKEEVTALKAYFETQFGMSIADAVEGK